MTWEDQAENWLAWVRTPGHDAYWSYRDAFFPLVPPPGRWTLEVEVTFRGWCYPLEAYVRAFEAARFLVKTLREPADPRENPRHWRIPMLLMGRCLKFP